MLTFYFFFNVKGLTLRTITSSSISPTQLPIQKQCSKGKGRSKEHPGAGSETPGFLGVSLPQGAENLQLLSVQAQQALLPSRAPSRRILEVPFVPLLVASITCLALI